MCPHHITWWLNYNSCKNNELWVEWILQNNSKEVDFGSEIPRMWFMVYGDWIFYLRKNTIFLNIVCCDVCDGMYVLDVKLIFLCRECWRTRIIKALRFYGTWDIYFMMNGRLPKVIEYFGTCDSFRQCLVLKIIFSKWIAIENNNQVFLSKFYKNLFWVWPQETHVNLLKHSK